MTDLETLVRFSNRYGSSTDYVIAGGGNTSCKDAAYLYVKGSGTALATITADGFVAMDREKLACMWDRTYPQADDAREAAALARQVDDRVRATSSQSLALEQSIGDFLGAMGRARAEKRGRIRQSG